MELYVLKEDNFQEAKDFTSKLSFVDIVIIRK